MEFTNKRGYPDWVHRGLVYSNYNRDGIKFSISNTKLIDSPQIAQFWKTHGREVIEDSGDRVWAAFGSATHQIFEDANRANADVILEKRYLHTYDGHVVAGQIDAYEISSKTLADVKTSGCYKVQKGDYSAWEKQLNVGAALMRHNGYEVSRLQIVALLKDWQGMKAKTDRSYPQSPVAIIDIDMWSPEAADDFIRERLALHFNDEPKTCTNEERWYRPGKWAVHKPGQKRAARLLDTKEAAERWGESQLKKFSIVERPTVYTRCESFCPFKSHCDQYKEDMDAKQERQGA